MTLTQQLKMQQQGHLMIVEVQQLHQLLTALGHGQQLHSMHKDEQVR
jgi:hypothetical protein